VAVRIVLAWSKYCEAELIKSGFVKKEVYVNYDTPGKDTDEQVANGDRAFFDMHNKPYQFVTTSWWGAGVD